MRLDLRQARGFFLRTLPLGGTASWLAVFVLMISGNVNLGAQDDKLSKKALESLILGGQFRESEREFKGELATATRATQQRFIAELTSFEKRAAESGAYALAIRYRDERLALQRERERHDPEAKRARKEKALELRPGDAALSGSVWFKGGVLERWRTSKSNVTWNLRGFKPGKYDVVLRYACSEAESDSVDSNGVKHTARAGGQVTFGEMSNLIGQGEQRLSHRILPTKNWSTFRELSIGTLTITNRAPALRLEVVDVGELGLMKLESIRLEPLENRHHETPAHALPSPTELRQSFVAMVKRKKQALEADHLKALHALRERAQATEDFQLVKAVDQAIQEATAK